MLSRTRPAPPPPPTDASPAEPLFPATQAAARSSAAAATPAPPGAEPVAAEQTTDRAVAQAGPLVGIIMGSRSDWPTLSHAAATLERLGVAYEARVVSAHRTPDRLRTYAMEARDRGLRVIIAGAGGAAHLPGMCAAWTVVPVLGVPIESPALKGLDSLLSIVQMPGGIPVATLAIGRAGAVNAALLATAILAGTDPALAARLDAWRSVQTAAVPDAPAEGDDDRAAGEPA